MLSTECCVCGHRRKFRNLMYDQNLRAYCALSTQCTKNHPNSPRNVSQRGALIDLIDHQDAKQIAVERNDMKYEQSARDAGNTVRDVNINRLVTGNISFRLKTDLQAEYIAYMMGKSGSKHLTVVMLDILDEAIRQDLSFLAVHGGRVAVEQEIRNPAVPVKPAPKIEPRKAPNLYTRTVEEDEGEFVL